MTRFIGLAALLLLSACAEANLTKSEEAVTHKADWTSNLTTLAEHSQYLSDAYRDAAQQTQKQQDVAAAITILAAVGTVSGLVSDASSAAVSNRALVGATATTVATRTTPSSAIKGLYIASKRMNCVATTAQIGRYLVSGPGVSSKTVNSARAATYGAVNEIQVLAREALVRDVESFQTVRTNLIDAIPTAEQQSAFDAARAAGKINEAEVLDVKLLNQYLELLDNCLADAATLTAVGGIPAQPK